MRCQRRYPTEVLPGYLEGRPKRERGKRAGAAEEAGLRRCAKCGALNPRIAAECEECGEEFPGRRVREIAGELREMYATRVARLRKTPMRTLLAEARSPGELHKVLYEIASARGYKPGWAWYRWQEFAAQRAREAR
jgi:hypothetical protein